LHCIYHKHKQFNLDLWRSYIRARGLSLWEKVEEIFHLFYPNLCSLYCFVLYPLLYSKSRFSFKRIMDIENATFCWSYWLPCYPWWVGGYDNLLLNFITFLCLIICLWFGFRGDQSSFTSFNIVLCRICHLWSCWCSVIYNLDLTCRWLFLLKAAKLFFVGRYSITKAFCIAFVMTFFSAFDVPVFWPILLFYWVVLFTLTMRRQISHMIKYKYVPFSFGKQVGSA